MDSRRFRTWTAGLVTASIAVVALAATSQESGAAPVGSATGTVTADVASVASPPAASDGGGTAALDAVATTARFSISVLDVGTGELSTYGTGSFDTASIVKVDVLAALLWQHQEAGTTLDASELALATDMIERSDNAATTTLFEQIGGKEGLDAFDAMIGLTSTDVGSNGDWGLTRTTSEDQVRLLEVVLGSATVLTDASQDLVRALMSRVVDEQRFGVTAVADEPDDAAVKVGYLQRSATGLWDVTSIGEVVVDGRTYLVAVLSDANESFDEGVSLVDDVVRAAVLGAP